MELLTALTLSAMLMAILFTLVCKLSLARVIVKKEKPFEPWKSMLKQQLQEDYVGCRSVLIDSGQIQMQGYAAMSDQEGIVRSVPCSIRYFIVSDESENLLFREQRNLLRANDSSRELVCRSVSGFRPITQLSTDVAPGILMFEVNELTEESADAKESQTSRQKGRSTNATKPKGPFHVVLLPHGAPE